MDLREVRALLQAGRIEAAAMLVDALLAQAADQPALWEARAYVALQQDDGDTAIRALQQAVQLAPGTARWLAALGRALHSLGRHAEAEPVLHQAFRLAPRDLGVMLSLAQTLYALAKPDEAAMLLRRLVALDPVQPAAWQLLGRIAAQRGDTAAAVRALERAAAMAPDDARIQVELARACGGLDPRRALTALERAVSLDPRHLGALTELIFVKRELLQWEGLESLQQRWQAWVEVGVPVLPERSLTLATVLLDDPQQCLRVARSVSGSAVASGPSAVPVTPIRWTPGSPMRVGVLLDELRAGSATADFVELLERLRLFALELTVFLDMRGGATAGTGELKRRLQAIWPVVELHEWPLAKAVQRIADGGLHVLLDATGASGRGRSRLPLARPCARQWLWPLLPMPGVAGVHDAMVVDQVLGTATGAPSDSPVELRLECSVVTLDTRLPAVPATHRGALGISPTAVVYAYFGAAMALSPEVLDGWALILRQVPQGVLWVQLMHALPECVQRLESALRDRGVSSAQIRCEAGADPEAVRAFLPLVDLLLDPWPCSGRAQAAAAALTHTPVLTWVQPSLAGRVAASLNVHQQLDALNATTLAGYIDLAVAIGRNPDAAAMLRGSLQAQRGADSVLDQQHTARCLYRLLEQTLQG